MGSEGEKQTSNAPNESLRQTVVNIEGMTCEGCATTVSETLRNLPGITAVQVDLNPDYSSVRRLLPPIVAALTLHLILMRGWR